MEAAQTRVDEESGGCGLKRLISTFASLDPRQADSRPVRAKLVACQTGQFANSYCASSQVSDPTSLTATFENVTLTGLPSAVPR